MESNAQSGTQHNAAHTLAHTHRGAEDTQHSAAAATLQRFTHSGDRITAPLAAMNATLPAVADACACALHATTAGFNATIADAARLSAVLDAIAWMQRPSYDDAGFLHFWLWHVALVLLLGAAGLLVFCVYTVCKQQGILRRVCIWALVLVLITASPLAFMVLKVLLGLIAVGWFVLGRKKSQGAAVWRTEERGGSSTLTNNNKTCSIPAVNAAAERSHARYAESNAQATQQQWR